ncbi:MAG: YraN family protein [Spirochaetes bacterium]|nr:YraN family protein [Spirochaetota bacterium]
MLNKRQLGKIGEDIATKYLENNGIQIIERNYYTKYGEIDLIGIENKTIIFIEVKLRKNKNFGLPSEAIDSKKLKRIHNTATNYISEMNFTNNDCRFDVICLFYSNHENLYKIEWLKNQYFD